MSRNPIQFQKGLSFGEFSRLYGSEEQCEAALKTWRWPAGFVCPHCGCLDHGIVGRRRLHLCHGCRRQTSVKAGTIFAKSLLPLRVWFQGMWLLTQSKTSISTLDLSRQLGIRWDSAWLMRQKLATVMEDREAKLLLDGRIEVDDAVLGGQMSEADGGKRGRGGPNKVPFVIAVETREGRPQRMMLAVLDGFKSTTIAQMAKAHFAASATIVSDGLACFRSVRKAGCRHDPLVLSRIDRSHKLACFRWANTLLGNVKTAIAGTLKSVRPPYAARYLAEFQYRFNRRFNLNAMISRLAGCAIRSPPRPYQSTNSRTGIGNQAYEREAANHSQLKDGVCQDISNIQYLVCWSTKLRLEDRVSI